MTDESSLYENLIRATDNLEQISFTRYATVTSTDGSLATVKEDNNTNIHQIQDNTVQVGDNVVLGFVDNNYYEPIILKNLSQRTVDLHITYVDDSTETITLLRV